MVTLALAVAAAACLIVGLISGTVLFTYIALGTSLLALLALGGSAWRRRHHTGTRHAELATAEGAESSRTDDSPRDNTDTTMSPTAADNVTDRTEADDVSESKSAGAVDGLQSTSIVYVLAGRKRFHLETCHLISDRSADELTLIEAREENFTPCSICFDAVDESSTLSSEVENSST